MNFMILISYDIKSSIGSFRDDDTYESTCVILMNESLNDSKFMFVAAANMQPDYIQGESETVRGDQC